MADNVTANPGSGGSTFAADDIGSVYYPRTKITVGADGANDGDVSSANPLPVNDSLARTSLAIIDDWDETDRCKVNPIAGQAGVAAGAGAVSTTTQRVTLASDDPAVVSLQAIDNAISGNELQVDVVTMPNVTISGTVTVDSELTTGDLDTGAGTDTRAVVGIVGSASGGGQLIPGSSTDGLLVNLGANNDVTVTGSVTANAGTNLNTSALALESGGNLAACATSLSAIDDAVYVDNATFTNNSSKMLGVCGLYATSWPAVSDGSVQPFRIDADGALHVDVVGGGPGAHADDGDFTATATVGNPAMGVYESTPTTVTAGDMGIVGITQRRHLKVTLFDTAGSEVSVGGGTQYDEDSAHVSGDKLTMAGVVRADTAASTATTDGDRTCLITDSTGRLWCNVSNTVAVQESGAALTSLQLLDDTIIADDATFTPATTKVCMAGFTFDDVSPDSVNEGDGGAARMSANRCQYVMLRDNAGNERGLNVDASGNITVNVTGTVTVGSHAVTNAGTFAVQPAGATAADAALTANPVTIGGRASTATPTAMSADGDVVDAWFTRTGAQVISGDLVDDAAFTPGTSRVTPIGFQADETAADSVDEGDAGCPRMTLDRRVIVVAQSHSAGGATPGKLISAASTNATSVKASAGTLYSLYVTNTNAAIRYLKLYNKASAPTVGTDTPVQVFGIPGNTAGAGGNVPIAACGIAFTTGIAFALTTGATDADTGAVAANEIVLSYSYT